MHAGTRTRDLLRVKQASWPTRPHAHPHSRLRTRTRICGAPRRGTAVAGRATIASIAQLAEHALSKRKVTSSILVGGLPAKVLVV